MKKGTNINLSSEGSVHRSETKISASDVKNRSTKKEQKPSSTLSSHKPTSTGHSVKKAINRATTSSKNPTPDFKSRIPRKTQKLSLNVPKEISIKEISIITQEELDKKCHLHLFNRLLLAIFLI